MPLFGARYFFFFPATLVLRFALKVLLKTQRRHPLSSPHLNLASAATVGVAALGVAALSAVAPAAIQLCTAADPPPCEHRLPFTSTPPPAPPRPPSLPVAADDYQTGECWVANRDGEAYCTTNVASDYIKMLGVVHSFFHYTLVYARLPTLLLVGVFGSIAQLIAVFVRHELEGNPPTNDARFEAIRQLVNPMLLLGLGHLFGVLSYLTHQMTLHQAMVLTGRQQRLLTCIKDETEQCEQLLKNILPPHLIGALAGMVELHAKRNANGGGAGDSAFALSNPALLAQQYTECTFLFAKIGGLTKLVNDDKAEPKQVMRVLQRMFDAFDKLCDIYKVQKVRKTANEYYLVAAGLPDPRPLPTAKDRACGIAAFAFAVTGCMDVLNIELRPLGIAFTLQVGLHSGSAIAGIIGHKTFQYDLCGDAVNTAARMCTYSSPGQVRVRPSRSLRPHSQRSPTHSAAPFTAQSHSQRSPIHSAVPFTAQPHSQRSPIHSAAPFTAQPHPQRSPNHSAAPIIAHSFDGLSLIPPRPIHSSAPPPLSGSQVHASEDSYKLLAHRYPAVSRGQREIKGKGLMTTYYMLNVPADSIEASMPQLKSCLSLPPSRNLSQDKEQQKKLDA